MVDRIIKWIVETAIESFPIDEEKKTELLKNIRNKRKMRRGEEDDVLR